MSLPASPVSKPSRRLDIDNTKAAAIVLVVAGHISIPNGPMWAFYVRYFIYNFHMPLFMYLSGYVFFLHFARHSNQSIAAYTLGRSKRLLALFVVMGIIVVNAKYFGRDLGPLNRSDFNYLQGYKYLIFDTQKSPSLDLWYLIVLFIFSVFSYVFLSIHKYMIYVLLLISFILYSTFAVTEPIGGLTDDFYLSRICWFYIFFVMGCITSANWVYLESRFRQLWPIALIALAASELAAYYGVPGAGSGWRFLICGLFSMIGIHGIWVKRTVGIQPFLSYVSRNTLAIYLFNTFVIAVFMILLQRNMDVRHHMALVYLLLIPLGLLIPCLFRSAIGRSRMTSWILPYIS